jgi:hypothetical protein
MNPKQLILATCRAAGSIFKTMHVGRDVLNKKSNTERLAHDLIHGRLPMWPQRASFESIFGGAIYFSNDRWAKGMVS